MGKRKPVDKIRAQVLAQEGRIEEAQITIADAEQKLGEIRKACPHRKRKFLTQAGYGSRFRIHRTCTSCGLGQVEDAAKPACPKCDKPMKRATDTRAQRAETAAKKKAFAFTHCDQYKCPKGHRTIIDSPADI